MTVNSFETDKGVISHLIFEPMELLGTGSDLVNAIMNSPTPTMAIDQVHITDKFFDLKTGMAGEVLQKISNYRKRLIILGEFENVDGKSLRDFIYESNRFGKVLFVNTLAEAIKLLK